MIKKIPKNHVLIQVDCLRHKKIAFKNGSKIIIDPSFKPEQHAQTNGVVRAIPESIYFNKKDIELSAEFLIDIEVKIGDQVFFHYLQINEAVKQNKIIEMDGLFFIFVRHDSLFCAIRDEKIIMLNGWMLLEPIEEIVDTKKLSQLPKDRQKSDPLKGRIKHLGSSVKEYFYSNHETDDGIDVKEGDTVIFLPHSDIPLEYKLHQNMDSRYYRVQRKELLSIYIN